MRDVKFVRLDLVICEIFCDIVLGRTKLDSGPMSVGRVSFDATGIGFLTAGGAFDCWGCGCDDAEDEPGIGILVPSPLIGIRDWLSWK